MDKYEKDIIVDDLITACVDGNILYVKHIFENYSDKYLTYFENSVWSAAAYNHFDIVKYLFEKDKEMCFFHTTEANTSFYYAIKHLNIDAVKHIAESNKCDYVYSINMFNSILNTHLAYNTHTTEEEIQKKIELTKTLFNNETFYSKLLSIATMSEMPMYIKKYLYTEKKIDFNNPDNKRLLSSLLMDISKTNDINLLNDLAEHYNIIDSLDNDMLILNAVIKNNAEVLRKILELTDGTNIIYNFNSILHTIDYKLEMKKDYNLTESMHILLEDGRILQSIKNILFLLSDRTIKIFLNYYNLQTKEELISIFNFF